MSSRAVGAGALLRQLGQWRHEGIHSPPAFRALADRIVVLVGDGRLPLGVALPGERDLAATLGVSRSTVAAAFSVLREAGCLQSSQGSRSTVTYPVNQQPRPNPVGLLIADTEDPSLVDLSYAALPAPPQAAQAYADALADLPALLSGHGLELRGLPELRAVVADRYTTRGLPTRAEQILITSGAQHAMSLVFDALLARGDRVIVDHPTYPHALAGLTAAGARPIPVALRTDSDQPAGWDLDGLRAAVRQTAPAAAYLIPDFHNPTGLCLAEPGRRQVMTQARDARMMMIIDETLVELGLDEPAPPPMASFHLAGGPPTVSIGSASKSIWGGLRIGWIRADEAVITRLLTARPTRDLGAPPLEQLVATRLLGQLDALLADRGVLLRGHRTALEEALRTELPQWKYTDGAGGMSLWALLPTPVSSRLARAAQRHGVAVSAGPLFGLDGAFERRLRLPYVLPADRLRAGVHALSQAWQEIAGTRPSLPPAARVLV